MANEKILELKKGIVSEIKDRISKSVSTIFFDYRGLTDEQISEIRKKLKETNSDMKVYKNTMTKKALEALNYNMEECTVGPSAIVFGDDSISPIKILTEYAKEHKVLTIKGGIVDGKETSLEVLAKLATIPSRDTLLTMLAGGMIGIAKDLSVALHLYAEKLNEEGK